MLRRHPMPHQQVGAWPLDATDVPVVRSTLPSPQMIGTVIPWQVSVQGKADKVIFKFIISDGKNEVSVQKGKSTHWLWHPTKTGTYMVKAVAEDDAGHRMAGDWSQEYRIVPALSLTGLTSNKSSPQKAGTGAIAWHAVAKGGVPPLTYEFISQRASYYNKKQNEQQVKLLTQEMTWGPAGVEDNKVNNSPYDKELIEQRSKLPTWQWRPLDRGQYRITVRVRDAAGNTVQKNQPIDYKIRAPLGPETRIAVLPVQNLSGAAAPLTKIREHLKSILLQKGTHLVDEQRLQDFINRHRIRYSAGIDADTVMDLRRETGATDVLLSVAELYKKGPIPRISITAWLDRCGTQPSILWMASKSISGDASPGLLNLGMISNADKLLDKVLASLFKSWGPTLMPAASQEAAKKAAAYCMRRWHNISYQKFRPQYFFHSKYFSPAQRYTVGVMPFYNLSERKYAGELMELHFIRQLRKAPNFTVIDPGEIRRYLLRYRIIMDDGLSLSNADVLFAKLGVDMIVSGNVFDYQDYSSAIGKPIVDFSVGVFSKDGDKTLWTSNSYTDGEKGVFFFGLGKIYTAHNLASRMVGTIARMIEQ